MLVIILTSIILDILKILRLLSNVLLFKECIFCVSVYDEIQNDHRLNIGIFSSNSGINVILKSFDIHQANIIYQLLQYFDSNTMLFFWKSRNLMLLD